MIATFEGLRRRAARLPDGRWTIGYGHTLSAREGAEVSREDAEALLHFDLLPIAEAVNNLVYTPLTQNQFDALVAFAYNVGIDAFRTSNVLKRVNEGRLTEAACALDLWRKAELSGDPVVLDALIRRRAAEKALFLTPPDGFVPTPTPLLRPMPDEDLAPMLPQSRPADIDVNLDGDDCTVTRVPPPIEISTDPVELSESEAEPAGSQPAESQPVEAAYMDAAPVQTYEDQDVQALESASPGGETVVVKAHETLEITEAAPAAGGSAQAAPVAPEAAAETPAPADSSVAPAPPSQTAPIEETSIEEPPAGQAPFDQAPVDQAPVAETDGDPTEEDAAREAPSLAAASTAERIYAPEPDPQPAIVFSEETPSQASPPTPSATPVSSFGYGQASLSPGWRVRPAVRAEDPAPDNVLVLTPPPEVAETAFDPRADAAAAPEAAEYDDLQAPLFLDGSMSGQRVVRHEDIASADTEVGRTSMVPFIIMGVVGLVAFAGAVAAILKGDEEMLTIATVLAGISIACVATAVYFLTRRMSGPED